MDVYDDSPILKKAPRAQEALHLHLISDPRHNTKPTGSIQHSEQADLSNRTFNRLNPLECKKLILRTLTKLGLQ